MRRRVLVLGSATALIMAACSAGSHRASPSTLSPPPVTTAVTQPASPNPDAIPAVITPAYVDAVFKVLNHINGNAIRALVASRQVTPTVKTYLRAIYNDPLYAQELQIARESIAGNLSNVRMPPGDLTTTVKRLLRNSPDCLFAETQSDFSRVLINPDPPARAEYFSLTPKQAGADPDHWNPTPWGLGFNADYKTPTTIPPQCPSS
jgi:hypothetical protein